MYLAGQPAAVTAHRLSLVASDGRGRLMNPDNRGVDHLDTRIMCIRQCVYDAAPNTAPTPANEASIASGVWTEVGRQIPPRRARSQDPEDAVEDTTVIYPQYAARLARHHRFDSSPFIVAEFVAHDAKLSV